MNIGILGTGVVGRTLAAACSTVGHQVMMGTRDVSAALQRGKGNGPSLDEWIASHPRVRLGTFHEAAVFGDLLVNAVSGGGTMNALEAAGTEALGGKVLIDISNPLDFSGGFPPTLSVSNTDSLGEQIQRAYPSLRVVKALNTLTAPLMTEPSLVNGGDHDLFLCGNDAEAKRRVTDLLQSFGWKSERLRDLGDISNARGTEQLLPLWVRLYGLFQTSMFQFKIVR